MKEDNHWEAQRNPEEKQQNDEHIYANTEGGMVNPAFWDKTLNDIKQNTFDRFLEA